MVIGIDNSPLVSTHKLAHKIRGTGFYTRNLIDALVAYHPENQYVLFQQGNLPKRKIDIFHYPYFDPFFLSLPFNKKGKTIVTIHDLTPLVFPRLFPVGVRGRVKYEIQKKLAKRTDAVITDSDSSKKDIERIMGMSPAKVFSIPLAAGEHFKKIDVARKIKDELLKKYDLPEKFALYVGDATPNKNLPVLMDAIKIAQIPLVLVGGALAKQDVDYTHPWNRDIEYVQHAARDNSSIKILGFVPDEDLVLLYNMAVVFVFPSVYEGFGLPVLEAASCGCPVITTKGGSIPEVMGDAGIYIKPNDEQSLAQEILSFFKDENKRLRYSKRGILQSEKFSWKKTADNTAKIYEKVYSEA